MSPKAAVPEDGAGEFPSIGVEEENIEPNIEEMLRSDRASIGYSAPFLVPEEEFERDTENRASEKKLVRLACVLTFNPGHGAYNMLLLTDKLLVSIDKAVTQVSAGIHPVSTAIASVLTITVLPRRTQTLHEYSLELHILTSCTGNVDQDVVQHLDDASYDNKAQEFGVATHKQPVQRRVLLCGSRRQPAEVL